ncbi:hypothetical protein [Roseomonas sp. CAU 1739]|uniref:hypothetical protein n=1 Tax=Roseomonas sp. CAU 1739 TaxID=3140364 RepID=UPI00325B43D0
MVALVEASPGLAVLAAADPLMLPPLRQDGAGCITATSNLLTTDLTFVFRNFTDPAQDAAQARIVAARNRASRFAQMASLGAARRSRRRAGLTAPAPAVTAAVRGGGEGASRRLIQSNGHHAGRLIARRIR